MKIILFIATVGCIAYAASATEPVSTDSLLNGISSVLTNEAADTTNAGDILTKTKTVLSGGKINDATKKKLLKLLADKQKDRSITLNDIFTLINDPELLKMIEPYLGK